MPSFQWLKPFSKKKAHGGTKFHEYHHGYDNLRHTSYPNTPPTMMGGQQNPYTHQQAPPHSFSHRQHLYPQQLIVQSPPPPPPVATTLNQPQPHQFHPQTFAANGGAAPGPGANHNHCQCNQCSNQHQPQPQQMQQSQVNTNGNHQMHNPPQHQLVPQSPPQPLAQAQVPIINSHMPIISPPPIQQQYQQQPQQTQALQTPQTLHQHQHTHQPCQHAHQPQQVQQPIYQCQNSFIHNGHVNQSFTNNTSVSAQNVIPQSPPQAPPQCTCQQHCLFQQQHQQQQQQSYSSQQQYVQQLDHTHAQTNGTCQHQMTSTLVHNGATLNGGPQMTHLQNNPHDHMMQQQTCQSTHIPAQVMPTIMTSPTPGTQPQQLTSHHPNTVNPASQQFQYHTIQPAQYQQQKQQMQLQMQQQQQHHHRVQSLHHQQTQTLQQLTHQSLKGPSHSAQSQNQLSYQDPHQGPQQEDAASVQHPPSRLDVPAGPNHDYSRYANMQSLIDNTNNRMDYGQSTKYQEHVYYNQKPELPPYESPPDYETFLEHRKMYNIDMHGQHMTHHSESLVLHRTDKDSSYENLRTKSSLYSNLCISRQEPGFTS